MTATIALVHLSNQKDNSRKKILLNLLDEFTRKCLSEMQQTEELEQIYKQLRADLQSIQSDRIKGLLETVRKNETIILKQADTIEKLQDDILALKKTIKTLEENAFIPEGEPFLLPLETIPPSSCDGI